MAQGVNGDINNQSIVDSVDAFGSGARSKSAYNNGIPTWWNIELPNLLDDNPNIRIVYHENTPPYKQRIVVSGKEVYRKYYFEGKLHPEY